MTRLLGALVALCVVGVGCTSVRMTQRDGCWVKQTEKWPRRVTEELGPCARVPTQWADDRLTRLVQECVAQADHRWQTRALQAWAKGGALPAQEDEQQVLEQCMTQASESLVGENDALKARLAEMDADRSSLRTALADERGAFREDHSKVLDALAEAAKKPAPNAVATATSNGTATTESRNESGSNPSAHVASSPALHGAYGAGMPAPVMCAQPQATQAQPGEQKPLARAIVTKTEDAPAPRAAPKAQVTKKPEANEVLAKKTPGPTVESAENATQAKGGSGTAGTGGAVPDCPK